MRSAVWGWMILAGLAGGLAVPGVASAQENGHDARGRKYKAPPATTHIEVLVLKGFNKKPIMNAAVIFHPIDADGKDEGTLEVKSGPDGKASIDVIPMGSQVRVQVLANGFATFAEDMVADSPSRSLTVSMIRPQAQISAYQDNEDEPSKIQPGIQVPIRKTTKKKDAHSTSPNETSASPDAAGSASDSGAAKDTASGQESTKPQ